MDDNNDVSYSKAGKDSLNKYLYLLKQNPKYKSKVDMLKSQILFDKNEYSDEENAEDYFEQDIFNQASEKKVGINDPDKIDIKSTCFHLKKEENNSEEFLKLRNDIINNKFDLKYDKFKYHLLHHNDRYAEFFNTIKSSTINSQYEPKLEYTYKKIIYSIPFKKMTGRKNLFLNKNKNLINNISLEKNPFQKTINKAKSIDNVSPINMNNYGTRKFFFNSNNLRLKNGLTQVISNKIGLIKKSDSFKKENYNSYTPNNFHLNNNEINYIQNAARLSLNNNKEECANNIKINHIKLLKTQYLNKQITKPLERHSQSNKNFSTLKSFNNIIKLNEDIPINNNQEKEDEKEGQKEKENNTTNENEIIDIDNSNNKIPLGLYKTPQLKGINFKKMLSRDYLNKVTQIKGINHPMVTPNYSAIEPKLIMKVIYSKSKYDKFNTTKTLKTYISDYTYNINKLFNKYNNHNAPKKFNLSKMIGRTEDSKNPLPVFMQRSFDRNSMNYFNESSLKMNNYSNIGFKDVQSSFNEKKTFNVRLKLDELNNETKIKQIDKKNWFKKLSNQKIRYLDEKKDRNEINMISKNSWWKKNLGEYYRKDYDEIGQNYPSFLGSKVDGITFKLFKNESKYKNLLTKHEKELFSII